LAAGWLAWLLCVIVHPGKFQWDLPCYYYGAQAMEKGLNPFDFAELRALSGQTAEHPYDYPLAVPFVCKPLAALPYDVAYYVWLALKVAALGGLLAVWRLGFLRRSDGLLLSAVAFFGFYGPMVWDLQSGNHTAFDQVFLWLGLLAYLHDRRWLFAACIVPASLANLTPAAFLGLLLVGRGNFRRNLLPFAVGMGVVGIVFAGPFLARPDLWPSFVADLAYGRDTGSANPCFVSLVDEALGWRSSLPLAARRRLAEPIWAAFALLVAAVSLRRFRQAAGSGDRFALAMAWTILYALMMPRMMLYTYMMLVVPAVAAVEDLSLSRAVLAVALLSVPTLSRALPGGVDMLVRNYYPWFLLVGLWAYWLWRPSLYVGYWQRMMGPGDATGQTLADTAEDQG
jgi:hypothetical protein